MSDKRVNVLIYSGNGSTIESVKHCLWSLRRLLGPNYAVIPVTGDTILKEPWQVTCALFVMPGGADMGYCRTLNGAGNRLISAYVNKGGKYLGLCAGGYYASKKCEFEVGRTSDGYEVIGDRELGFFPGTCRGLAFPGFVYHSEGGTSAAEMKVNKQALSHGGGALPEVFRTYYNGGGVFVDAEKFKDRGVEILASYTERLHVESGEGKAAVVYCRVGDGAAVLTGPHPEFSAANLNDRGKDRPDYPRIVEALATDDKPRVDFMKATLAKLGLQVNQENQDTPSLSLLHLSSARPSDISELLVSLTEIIEKDGDKEMIKAENDTFCFEKEAGSWHLSDVAKALPEAVQNLLPESLKPQPEDSTDTSYAKPMEAEKSATDESGIIDYDKVIKRLLPHESSIPEPKETPYFNHAAYFSSLLYYSDLARLPSPNFGTRVLYGEVVTSTSTLLDKNPKLLSLLPTGFTATATTQVAGRGRGNNVWVSPPGSLVFSTVLRHPLSLSTTAPVVFVQYIMALAIAAGIKNYDRGYGAIPVKLKWPNDIYALDPTADKMGKKGRDRYVKIGGILVNSSYSGGDYTLVCGAGVNVSNAAPTTSLNLLATAAKLPHFLPERLLASILVQFEKLHLRFMTAGFSEAMLEDYYSLWLHGEQVVTLEAEGGQKAVIRGITKDWGLLVAEELGWEDRPTGRKWELQSDSNSFDFFKGLLRRKT